MRPSPRALAAAVIAMLALTGCSAQALVNAFCGGGLPPSSTPVVPQLLFPVPGWNAVADNAPALVVAYSTSSGPLKTIVLVPQNGAMISLGKLLPPPNPLPQPIAQELVPGTPMWSVTLPHLLPHTGYAVGYHFTVNYCGRSQTYTTPMGTFTTQ